MSSIISRLFQRYESSPMLGEGKFKSKDIKSGLLKDIINLVNKNKDSLLKIKDNDYLTVNKVTKDKATKFIKDYDIPFRELNTDNKDIKIMVDDSYSEIFIFSKNGIYQITKTIK